MRAGRNSTTQSDRVFRASGRAFFLPSIIGPATPSQHRLLRSPQAPVSAGGFFFWGLLQPRETKLTRMKANPSRSAPGRFIAWCKQEQASIQQQLELMETGKVLTGENRGSGWVDTTAKSIERGKARLVELEALLTESGPATVSKPKR